MDELFRFIRPHLIKNNLEIEFRLGKKNGDYFDTNIGKDNYEKLLRRLSKYPSWDSVKRQNATVFHGARKGLRVVYDEDKQEQVSCITKYKMAHLDRALPGQPFDVRVGLAIENPATYDENRDTFVRSVSRKRVSFIRKGLSIDLSIVENEDKDAEEPLVYQLELEIIEPYHDLSDTKIANHYQKVTDVLKLLAEPPRG